MQTQVTKKIDFKGKDLYIGLDVHKKSWSVTILLEEWNTGLLLNLPIPGLCIIIFKKCFREELITVPTKLVSVAMEFIGSLMILG